MSNVELFEQLLVGLKAKVDPEKVETFEHFYRNGEYGLAVEVLCEQLVESGESVPPAEAKLLDELARSMKLTEPAIERATREA